MKTYLKELRGQVRGNARLRRRLDDRDAEIQLLHNHVGKLVTMLDKLGRGDDWDVVMAARAIGWKRMPSWIREMVKSEIEKTFGAKL